MVDNNVLAGIALGGVQAGVNNMFAQHNAEVSYRRQNALMNKQNQMNMANMKSAPLQQVEGLRMAGFNPAMVAGAGSQSAPSVSQGNADMPQTIPFNAQDALAMAQIANVEANTDKVNEEKRGIEQRNDITDAANDAAVQGYLADWNREQEDLEKALKTMKPGSEEYNKAEGRIKEIEKMKAKVTDPNYRGALGIATGTEAARNETRDRANRLVEYLNGNMKAAVAEKELGNGTVAALAGMKKQEAEKLAQEIEKIKQDIAESESREELNDQTVLKLQADITKIGDEMIRAHLNDPNWIKKYLGVDSEEWKNYTDTQFRNAAFEVGKAVITGAATGGAIGAANSMLNSAKNVKNSNQSNYNWNGSGFEDGNIHIEQPFPGASIGDKPDGVSQFEWNRLQKASNRKSR